jgi:hypothetical protein
LPSRSKDCPLRPSQLSIALACLVGLGCSAAGLELENYAFYGMTPTPDGSRLRMINVTERVSRTTNGDTVQVAEGEFRIDTVRVNGERHWLASRKSVDVRGLPVLDSIWMDRYTLRTLRSVTRDQSGVTELEYNRRAIRSRRVTPDGKREGWRGMHQAEPYGLLGIEIVLGAMPLRLGFSGTLPVASGMGDREQDLRFQVVDHTQEPRHVAGGVTFRSVWLVQAHLGRETLHFWVDPEERAVVRRTVPGPNETHMVFARGPAVPRVNTFPVEPLVRERGRGVIRQGASTQPVAATPEGP